MAERDLVQLESELKTTETLQMAASMYRSNKWHMGWDVPQPENLHPNWRCPCFRKKVMKGSLHHLPQSVICIPTHFMREHPDTFQPGNLITLEGPSRNTWKVRATNKPILHSGWRGFAHDHDLREGDELCFSLTQPSHFVVDVLNRHGVMKESALTATNTGKYTVASVCYPYEYVHRPRKRKGRKISVTYREDFGYGVAAGATIASRCKTTARERSGDCNSYTNRLSFSHKRKQWECREEKDGREVLTILDSDDDDDDEEKRLLDHIQLSFGSARVQSYRMSKIQRLVAHMKQQGDLFSPWTNPDAVAGDDQRTVATQMIPAQEIAAHGEEITVAENVDPLHPVAAAELTTNQAQVSHDEDTTMSNEQEKETHLPRLMLWDHSAYHQITPEINIRADSAEVLQSHTISTMSLAAEHCFVLTVDTLADNAKLCDRQQGNVDPLHPKAVAELTKIQAPDKDTMMPTKEGKGALFPRLEQPDLDLHLQITPETILCAEVSQTRTISTASLPAERKSVQTVGPLADKAELLPPATKSHEVLTSERDCLFMAPQNVVDMPVLADTRTNADPIRERSVRPEPVLTKHELSQSSEPDPKEIIKKLQSSSAAQLYKHREFPKTTIISGGPGMIKTSTTACVLQSKRMPVAKLHRAQTLRAAQEMTRKLRSPTFVAVMKSCNVYSDFSMDIPAEFGKKSRLPAAEARVMLVCDEVPTMCKAVWIGTNPEKPKLGAEAWMEFSRSHFLEEGDVCVFELYNRVTIRIGIHIFRVVGLRRSSHPAHWTEHYKVVHLDAQQPSSAGAPLPLGSVEAL